VAPSDASYGWVIWLPGLAYLGLCLIAWGAYSFWMVFDIENRALWDQPSGTHVVEERQVY
jgi:hypothetical protein